jgi:hypothetical protein
MGSTSSAAAPAVGRPRLLLGALVAAALVALALPSAAFAAGFVYQTSFGQAGSGQGQFTAANFACTDPAGNVYVTDGTMNRVEKFGKDGAFLGQWGTTGSGPGQFNTPYGICYDPATGTILVADNGNHRIEDFTRAGTYIREFGDADLSAPDGICVTPAGAIYVTDYALGLVRIFTAAGSLQTSWLSTVLSAPTGIACDQATGSLYVADSALGQVFAYDSSHAALWDSGEGWFSDPGQVAVAPSGDVLVADHGWDNVFSWSADGASERAVTDDLDLTVPVWSGPMGVATAADGSVYVVNLDGARVDRWVDDTEPPVVWGGSDGEWHSADASATVGATDAGSGFKWFDVTGVGHVAAPWTVTKLADPVGHSTDGVWSWVYTAVDNVGNATPQRTLAVKIDTRAPVTRCSGAPSGWTNQPVSLSFTASDRGAGVAGTQYSTDGGGVWKDVPDDGVLPVTAAGDTTVQYRSSDAAVPANVEEPKSVVVQIDGTNPSVLVVNNVTVTKGKSATFKYAVTEAVANPVTGKIEIKKGSKVVKTIALGKSFTGDGATRSKSATISLAKGSYTWVVVATDAAGNIGRPYQAKKLTVK